MTILVSNFARKPPINVFLWKYINKLNIFWMGENVPIVHNESNAEIITIEWNLEILR